MRVGDDVVLWKLMKSLSEQEVHDQSHVNVMSHTVEQTSHVVYVQGCHKSFRTPSALLNHVRVHTGHNLYCGQDHSSTDASVHAESKSTNRCTFNCRSLECMRQHQRQFLNSSWVPASSSLIKCDQDM
jgi:hypothetical protein